MTIKKVKLEALKDCCGALLMHDFFTTGRSLTLNTWTESQRDYYKITQEWVDKKNKEENRESTEEYRNRLDTEIKFYINCYKGKKSYILAFLNVSEIELGIEEILLDNDFEVLVPETYNPTGTRITMYIHHLQPRSKSKVTSVLGKKDAA
jgi:hypothetical protein